MDDEAHEKALFDFDDQIDDLEQVEDRYPVVLPPPEESVLNKFAVKKTMRPTFA